MNPSIGKTASINDELDDDVDVIGENDDGNLMTIMSGDGDGDDINVPPPEYEFQHWQDLPYWHVALVGISAECSVSLEKYTFKS